MIIVLLLMPLSDISAKQDSTSKTGWEIGGILPMLAYDTDLGFQYGALAEIYDYGAGEFLPDYKQKFYLEISRSTKGNSTNQLTFDSKDIFGSGLRLNSEFNYLAEKALDFYGFNGASNSYNADFENDASSFYKSRMYYRLERNMLRIVADLHWAKKTSLIGFFAGIAYFGINISSVDINDLNKDLESGNKLPSTDSIPGIYETYVQSGIIPQKDKSGGDIVLIRSGAITDTRDNESFPTKGYWGEAFVQVSPGLFGNNNYGQFITTFRQYFSLSGDGNPVFAYRLAYSTKLWGDIPFYMLPFYHNTTETRDGFGSGKTIRGILRDRIAADAVLMGNFELRWKFVKFGLFDSNFYLALGLFFDSGIVTSDYELLSYLPVTENANSNGCFHNSCGAGLHVAMNENFILSFDIGKALNKTDGDFGFYIVMSWLY